jgi:hypothetical protein
MINSESSQITPNSGRITHIRLERRSELSEWKFWDAMRLTPLKIAGAQSAITQLEVSWGRFYRFWHQVFVRVGSGGVPPTYVESRLRPKACLNNLLISQEATSWSWLISTKLV